MPLINDSPQQSATRDDLDDLFNLDEPIDGAFRDANNRSDAPTENQAHSRRRSTDSRANLGIDEEIKITKRRQPVAKLDEARILSNAGIPKLRKITKDRLKFRGKGHEFSDVSRLLNVYQLWLDDLYPRAKFADGLAIIEKLGHKKLMQIKRKEWIDEGKQQRSHDGMSDDTEEVEPVTSQTIQTGDTYNQTTNGDEVPQSHNEAPTHHRENDDALERSVGVGHDDVEEDDLDALLAEESARTAPRGGGSKDDATQHDVFGDEMEAMADLNDPW